MLITVRAARPLPVAFRAGGDPEKWRPPAAHPEQALWDVEAVKVLPADRRHPTRRAVLRIGGALAHVAFSQRANGLIDVEMPGWPNPERWGWSLRRAVCAALLLTPEAVRAHQRWEAARARERRAARRGDPDRLTLAEMSDMPPGFALGLMVAARAPVPPLSPARAETEGDMRARRRAGFAPQPARRMAWEREPGAPRREY